MESQLASVAIPDEHREVMNMFASVWVKVEVKDEVGPVWSPDQPLPRSTDQNPFDTLLRPKKKKRRHGKTLSCDRCDYTTIYKNCLEAHVLNHFNAKPYACDLCNYATKYPSSLYRHTAIKHPDIAPNKLDNGEGYPTLKCDHCDYSTNFKWNLNSHKRKHKLDKQFKCSQCSYETAYRHNFVKHGKTHKDFESYRCDKCPFVTKFEGHIQRHLAKIHHEVTDKAHSCPLCTFSTKEKWRLNIHNQRSKHESVLKCTFCEFETYYNCEIKKHKKTHYSELYGSGRVADYSQLSSEVATMVLARQISRNDTVSQPYGDNDQTVERDKIEEVSKETNECNEESNKIDQSPNTNDHAQTNNYKLDPDCLDWHSIQVLESANKDRPFQCVMCSYVAKFKASVQRHFQRHHTGTQNRPYKCCNCDFSTKTKDQISLHNKRSKCETPVFCRICGFSTLFKCHLVFHQKSHYINKCTMCSYSCKQKYELTRHFATFHLGQGLKCHYCDFRSTRKESLLCHETIHTGVKPFKCGRCDYMSVRKSLLNNHMKRYHGDELKRVTIVSESKIETLKIPIGGREIDSDIVIEKDDCDVDVYETDCGM